MLLTDFYCAGSVITWRPRGGGGNHFGDVEARAQCFTDSHRRTDLRGEQSAPQNEPQEKRKRSFGLSGPSHTPTSEPAPSSLRLAPCLTPAPL